MHFTKMHGLGNDFILINCLAKNELKNPSAAAKKLCDRHFGIGADGLILVLKTKTATCLSMGNPHCVVFVDKFDFDVKTLGWEIENHKLFPKRTNVEFVKVKNKNSVEAVVWERGAGLTLACGTGACAVAVASVRNGKTGKNVYVMLPGGRIKIEWAENNHVYMTGPAETIFEGAFS